MTVRLECSLPDNVVEIGNEVAQGMIDALNAADSPSSSNPLLTKSAGDLLYLEKDGGGTVVGTVIVDSDGTVGGDVATVTGGELHLSKFGVGAITLDPVLGVVFPDATSQGSAAVFYDQSLNTTNNVTFVSVSSINGVNGTSQTSTGFTALEYGSGSPFRAQLTKTGVTFANISGVGIHFGDGTHQYTAGFPTPTGTTTQYLRGDGTTSTFAIDALAAVPAASTSTAGKVQLATDAQAIAGTSTTLAVTPAAALKEINRRSARRGFYQGVATLTTQTNGTGAGYTQVQQYTNIQAGNAGVAGFARGYLLAQQAMALSDWAKPWGFVVWTRAFNGSSYSGTEWRCGIGYTSNPTAGVAVGDLAVRGFGFKWVNGGNIFLQVHDGTTLRNIDTGYTPPTTGAVPNIMLEAYSDGAGNVEALVRVTLLTTGSTYTDYTVTSANGPTGAITISPNNGFMFQVQTSTTHTVALNAGGLNPSIIME